MPTDLVFVSLEDWDDVWRRNQFICAELSRRFPSCKILFVGLTRNLTHALRTGGVVEMLRRPATYRVRGFDNITVTRPLKAFPESLRVGRWVNDRLFRWHVLRAIRSAGIRLGFMLWLNAHSAEHLVGHLNESAVVYDVTDDWTSFDQPEAVRLRVVRQDAALCRSADAVIVCSQRLFDLKQGRVRSLHLIPNGVAAEHYRTANDPSTAVAIAAGWSRPVLGYTGTVHPDRVDVNLIRTIAQQWTGSIVLVGPDHLRPTDVARLDFPNVKRIGPVPYADVPKYMAGFDVCIVPHRVTPFTESLNPIKLWEYLAAGKPIVATPVAGFRDFPELVRLASTAEQFLVQARQAVEEAGTSAAEHVHAKRQAAARMNSWSARVDEVVTLLDQLSGSTTSIAV